MSEKGVPEDRPDVDVAFVVQRYGAGVTGGSESLARAVAERLTPFYRITVFTTCALDYVTWGNELAAGAEQVGGVAVRRFPSEEERDLASFNEYSEELYTRERTREEELEWLRRQGPYVPSLVEALAAERARFSAVVFFTYLYYPTYWGLRAAPERSVLVPTTHDEPPLRFSIFREVFAAPRALAFLTPPEEALVRSRFDVADRPAEVTGIGVDIPEDMPAADAFRTRNGLRGPYAVYAGRIDAGKGCDQMMAAFARYRSRGGSADLVLLGRLAMELPETEGVRYLGYVSEEDKMAAFVGASAVVCPSPYESLSIVLLEAFAVGTPGLVNARSAVLEDHVLRSNGGLYYLDADEFAEALDAIVRDERLRRALGEGGRRYVAEHYRWDAVLARYRRLIDTAARR